MAQPLNFQQVILKLHQFWSEQGCAIWEPYNVQVGAGTGNPATLLRVLGPEPWRVAYVEPSVRPDDGRYGENPNRMQKYYQYQVILKPDPGNPQELYLKSLEALGINPREHDIRFVEDNWESPALGAWGLGWEVWLDGQEITQFTYFQQAGGLELNPVSVEITYGVERIVLALQGKNSAWEIDWMPGLTYADMIFNEEVEYCRYYFDIADVDSLKKVYDTYEREMGRALEGDSLISAYDYVLKCSHLFNVLDTRGAIGVTERAVYFRRMRDMTRTVAKAYAEKRAELGHPLLKMKEYWDVDRTNVLPVFPQPPTAPADVLLEIGVEELPAGDVDDVIAHLTKAAPALFEQAKLSYEGLETMVTPRRIVLSAKQVSPRQADEEQVVKGPPAARAFDSNGQPTQAAIGFAKRYGLDASDLRREEIDGGEYVTALVKTEGKPATAVLMELLPQFIGGIKFGKAMRWNETNIAFSRPIRWLVALWGDTLLPIEFAGVNSNRTTRGLRPYGSPELSVKSPADYFRVIKEQGIILNREERRAAITEQITKLAQEVNGTIPNDPGLLDEVVNLVEAPTALRGTFEARDLELPRDVLVTVMRKHQRYFPVEDANGQLMAYFIAVRNGDADHLDKVIHGNEHVLRARFSDARYFYSQDIKKPLADGLPRLETLTFQEKLGSMRDKNDRVARLVPPLGHLLHIPESDIQIAVKGAQLAKADLAKQMVVEMTSLQGIMGREYALREGIAPDVAQVIFEHWLPRGAGDQLPQSAAGRVVALADKLDSLTGLFAAGLAPKATSDPYGLRRSALGIIQILAHSNTDVDLDNALHIAAGLQPLPLNAQPHQQLKEFLTGRLDAWLTEETDGPRDVIRAVLAEQGLNPARAYRGVHELAKWIQHPDWAVILDNFARCVRITRPEKTIYSVRPEAFTEQLERDLYAAYESVAKQLTPASGIDDMLTAFQPIVPAIQAFFNTILVHAEDKAVRENRLALLQAISQLQKGRADLSELSGF